MPLFGERHEIGEMADEHFDPLAEHRGRPTPSGMALRVRLCNFGQEAGRPSLVDSVEKGRSRSKLRAGPERDGSFRELQAATAGTGIGRSRSEEHTSELQSLMRISYAVFCLKKKTKKQQNNSQ